jgi:hypothetical protein
MPHHAGIAFAVPFEAIREFADWPSYFEVSQGQRQIDRRTRYKSRWRALVGIQAALDGKSEKRIRFVFADKRRWQSKQSTLSTNNAGWMIYE